MTPAESRRQRERVLARELLADTPEDRRGVYSRHPLSRAVPQGSPTIGRLAQSIRELGEMLTVAEQWPVYGERLEECERLADRIGTHLDDLRQQIRREYASCMGASV